MSRLRENLTSGSEGEGLETGLWVPRQSFTRQVFFKMAKQHLKLAREIQCRDFDALIAHTSFVFMRYMFLSYQYRMETDDRSLGDLFYACCDEVKDISFIEALYRILTLVRDRAKQLGEHCDKKANEIFNVIIDYALQCVNLSKNKVVFVNA